MSVPQPMHKRGRLLSVGQRTVFLLCVWGAIPVLLLAGAEAALRLLGKGQSTEPFLLRSVEGQQYYVLNKHYYEQFMGWALATDQWDTVDFSVCRDKPPGAFRVFVFGGSAAQGWPRPECSFGRILHYMLADQFPGTRFEVYNASFQGMNSHVMREIAEACARLEPDLFAVYMGNNEANGPYGMISGEGASRKVRSLWETRLAIWINRLRLVQCLTGNTRRPVALGARNDGGASSAAGANSPQFAAVLRNFEGNLAGICAAARRAGAPVLISTVGANLRHWPPDPGARTKDLAQEDLVRCSKLYEQGNALQEAGQHSAAQEMYHQALKIDDTHAELHFRLAESYSALQDYETAKGHYCRALDLDGFGWVRAKTAINESIRRVAGKTSNALLSDGAGALAGASPHGIPGAEVFVDSCHLTFEGAYVLASAVFKDTLEALPPTVLGQCAGSPIPPPAGQCARGLLLSRQDIVQAVAHVARVTELLGRQPSELITDRLADLPLDGTLFESGQPLLEQVAQAVSALPSDRLVRVRCVTASSREDPSAGVEVARQVIADLPGWRRSRRLLAHAYEEAGDAEQAVAALRENIALFPEDAANVEELGSALLGEGNLLEALDAYDTAANMMPGNPNPLIGCAKTLAELGRLGEAKEACKSAAAVSPHDGGILEQAADILNKLPSDQALEEWRSVHAEFPDSLDIGQHLAVALVRSCQFGEAQAAFARLTREGWTLAPLAQTALIAILADEGRMWTLEAFTQGFFLALDLGPADPRAWQLVRERLAAEQGGAQNYSIYLQAVLRYPEVEEAYQALNEALKACEDPELRTSLWRVLAHARPEAVRPRAFLAQALLEAEQIDEAEAVLAEATQLAPDDPSLRLRRVEILAAQGDFEAALAKARELQGGDEDPDVAMAAVLADVAAMFANAGNPAKAREGYQAAGILDPANAFGLLRLAREQEEAGQHEEAQQTYTAALEFEALRDNAFGGLRGLLGKQSDTEKEIQTWRRLAKAYPESALPLRYLAESLEGANNFGEAAALWAKVAGLPGNSAFDLIRLAQCQGRAGHPAESLAALKGALSQAPDMEQAASSTAELVVRALMEAERFEDAADYCAKAVDLMPQQPRVMALLGEALGRCGRSQEAVEAYRSALAQDSSQVYLFGRLDMETRKDGEAQERMAAWDELAMQFPESPDAFYFLGLARRDAGNDGGALEALERAVTLNPDSKAYLLELARERWRNGQHEQSATIYAQLAKDPTYANVAICEWDSHLAAEDRHDERVTLLQEAIESGSADVQFYERLASALEILDRKEEAIQVLLEIAARAGVSGTELERAGALLIRLGAYAKAIALLERAMSLAPDREENIKTMIENARQRMEQAASTPVSEAGPQAPAIRANTGATSPQPLR